jgi:hypothetical protein
MRRLGALAISGGKYPLKLLLSNSLQKCTHVKSVLVLGMSLENEPAQETCNFVVLHVDQVWETAELLWNAAVQGVVVHMPVSSNKR